MIGKPSEIMVWLLEQDKDKQYEIKIHTEKRSINANDYLWVLCTKIAEVLRTSKIEIYRKLIREYGIYQTLEIKTNASNTFIKGWEHNGLGWVCDIENQNEDKTTLFAYYGSSVYNKRAMGVLLDHIVEEAKELGIETMTPNEILNLKNQWKEVR